MAFEEWADLGNDMNKERGAKIMACTKNLTRVRFLVQAREQPLSFYDEEHMKTIRKGRLKTSF
ncbi:hypothetical protein [Desulfosporosinus orientis]|uniref:hypothetical protein n=1 Tax=Desulfosporosinus orientis TaxID=1563 RepID=UPI0002DE97C3|nr:hypothetical protein [Desulfosporosinus orientis]